MVANKIIKNVCFATEIAFNKKKNCACAETMISQTRTRDSHVYNALSYSVLLMVIAIQKAIFDFSDIIAKLCFHAEYHLQK